MKDKIGRPNERKISTFLHNLLSVKRTVSRDFFYDSPLNQAWRYQALQCHWNCGVNVTEESKMLSVV